MAPKKTTDQHS